MRISDVLHVHVYQYLGVLTVVLYEIQFVIHVLQSTLGCVHVTRVRV